MPHHRPVSTPGIASSGSRVLAYNPMSLEDLRPKINIFLNEDKEEQKRRADFLEEWRRRKSSGGSLNLLLQSAAGLFSGIPAFREVIVDSKPVLKLTLRIPFKR